jgi:hypothetical protein
MQPMNEINNPIPMNVTATHLEVGEEKLARSKWGFIGNLFRQNVRLELEVVTGTARGTESTTKIVYVKKSAMERFYSAGKGILEGNYANAFTNYVLKTQAKFLHGRESLPEGVYLHLDRKPSGLKLVFASRYQDHIIPVKSLLRSAGLTLPESWKNSRVIFGEAAVQELASANCSPEGEAKKAIIPEKCDAGVEKFLQKYNSFISAQKTQEERSKSALKLKGTPFEGAPFPEMLVAPETPVESKPEERSDCTSLEEEVVASSVPSVSIPKERIQKTKLEINPDEKSFFEDFGINGFKKNKAIKKDSPPVTQQQAEMFFSGLMEDDLKVTAGYIDHCTFEQRNYLRDMLDASHLEGKEAILQKLKKLDRQVIK